MNENYLKDAATELNKVFQFYKAKLKELPKEAKTDEEIDKVADWFGSTMNDFVALGESIEDADVRNFVDHFSVSCLADLQDKYAKKPSRTEYRWLSKNFTIDEFAEYLNNEAKQGDSFRVNGVTIEIKRINA